MPIVVLGVEKHPKKEQWRNVTLATGSGIAHAICFGPQADDLKKGDPLPGDWKMEPGEYGPVLRYPKRDGGGGRGGGFASWRNTEEGFKYEQQKMDRRTALMQATAAGVAPADLLSLANEMYSWLRKE